MPAIQPRNVTVLSHFDTVTDREIQSLLMSVPATSCPLDPIHTWLVKKLVPLLRQYSVISTTSPFKVVLFLNV